MKNDQSEYYFALKITKFLGLYALSLIMLVSFAFGYSLKMKLGSEVGLFVSIRIALVFTIAYVFVLFADYQYRKRPAVKTDSSHLFVYGQREGDYLTKIGKQPDFHSIDWSRIIAIVNQPFFSRQQTYYVYYTVAGMNEDADSILKIQIPIQYLGNKELLKEQILSNAQNAVQLFEIHFENRFGHWDFSKDDLEAAFQKQLRPPKIVYYLLAVLFIVIVFLVYIATITLRTSPGN